MKEVINKTMFVLNPDPSRGMMKYIKSNLSGDLIGAEIGVAEGYHVYKYLKTINNITHVYLVDPYEEYLSYGVKSDYSRSERDARKRLSIFGDKVSFIKETSENASKSFQDASLNYAYVDANHDFEHTYQDIVLWYPKVKVGGVIGGHDFGPHYWGVAKAVIQFAEENGLSIQGAGVDWWFQK